MSPLQDNFYKALQARRHACVPLSDSFRQALGTCCLKEIANPADLNILNICNKTLDWIEADGHKRALHQKELAYHNRQHFADVCLALAIFISHTNELSDRQKILLLLAALTHDFGHRGMLNPPSNCTQEEETISLLRSSPLSALLPEDLDLIFTLIQGTTPKNLDQTNLRHIEDPGNKLYLMQSLLNDADIATSFIEPLTPVLSKLILVESGIPNPNRNEIENIIQKFKKHYKITTSIAKSCLGMP